MKFIKSALSGSKIWASLFLFSFALVLPSLVVGQNKKPDTDSLEIGKVSFVHYAKPTNKAKPPVDGDVDKYKLFPRGLKWTETVDYSVNYWGSGLDGNGVMEALEASLEVWDDETNFELFATPLETSMGNAVIFDGANLVFWDDLNDGVIAMNTFWYYKESGEIVESDVVFNTDYAWSLSGEETKMDLQNIATHEFGHNGLADLYNPRTSELTMYGYSSEGETKKQTLGTGDISGIQELYNY